jgi:predicted nucleic acid-binding protein
MRLNLTKEQRDMLDDNLIDLIIEQAQELQEMEEARTALRSLRDELHGMGFIPEIRMVTARMSTMLRRDEITPHDVNEVLELMDRQRVRHFFLESHIPDEFIRIANVYDAHYQDLDEEEKKCDL